MNAYERFMSKVNKTDTCWLWTAYTKQEYGQFSVRINGYKKTYRAHRFIYEYFNGPIPEGMLVCHSCDVPACVNPNHLWIGTASENMIDCVNKKRHQHSKKTHCCRGHLFTINNIYPRLNNGRECRKCREIRRKNYLKKRKQHV